MSKYNLIVLWENVFPHQNEAYDYAGRRMLKSAIGNQNSRYCPTIDHIRPLAKGGKDVLENIVIWRPPCQQIHDFIGNYA